jgi:hypothetical protein
MKPSHEGLNSITLKNLSEMAFQNSEYAGYQVGPNEAGNFQLSRSYGLGCRRGTNFAFNGNGRGA